MDAWQCIYENKHAQVCSNEIVSVETQHTASFFISFRTYLCYSGMMHTCFLTSVSARDYISTCNFGSSLYVNIKKFKIISYLMRTMIRNRHKTISTICIISMICCRVTEIRRVIIIKAMRKFLAERYIHLYLNTNHIPTAVFYTQHLTHWGRDERDAIL